jgi:hypothetical protein
VNSRLLLAAIAVALVAGPVSAGAPPPPRTAAQKFAGSAVVVTGKVTAIEKDTVDAPSPYAGAKDKVTYKIAVVKIDSKLAGADNLTHIKIGFIPPAKPNPNVKLPPRVGLPLVELKEGSELLLFLAKHPTAEFYLITAMNQPVELSTEPGKRQLEEAKKIATILADPLKALKSDKPEVRAEAAATLIAKYRTYPELAANSEWVPVEAEESKLVLKALAEGDWGAARRPGPTPVATAFYQLGLTEKDGWKPPVTKPGEDFIAANKGAFAKWLDGPGKDYQLKKLAPKK